MSPDFPTLRALRQMVCFVTPRNSNTRGSTETLNIGRTLSWGMSHGCVAMSKPPLRS
jgi:hypothetical protein